MITIGSEVGIGLWLSLRRCVAPSALFLALELIMLRALVSLIKAAVSLLRD